MILVIGSTGTTRSEVVRLLATQGRAVRALVRSPEKAAALPAGVSLDSPIALGRAHAEVEQEIEASGIPYMFLRLERMDGFASWAGAGVPTAVEETTGTPARSFAAFARDHAGAFTA